MYPKPMQHPHPPIWVGGNSAAAMRRAARVGQGWMPLFQLPESIAHLRASLASACEEFGRSPSEVRLTIGCRFGFSDGTDPDRQMLSGTSQQMRDDVRRYEDAGVEDLHLVSAVPGATAEETERVLAWLERPEVRLVECPQGWSYPVTGAARFGALLAAIEAAPRTADPLADREQSRGWSSRSRAPVGPIERGATNLVPEGRRIDR